MTGSNTTWGGDVVLVRKPASIRNDGCASVIVGPDLSGALDALMTLLKLNKSRSNGPSSRQVPVVVLPPYRNSRQLTLLNRHLKSFHAHDMTMAIEVSRTRDELDLTHR